MRRRLDPGQILVVAGCTYEIVAILSGKIPTLSRLVATGRSHRWARYLVVLIDDVWDWHITQMLDES